MLLRKRPGDTELRVPYGVDASGRYLAPSDISEGFNGRLQCPGCQNPLIIRGGPGTRYRRHFAYHPTAPCSEETVLHRTAKHLIAQVLRDAMQGSGLRITVHRVCSRRDCGGRWSAPFSVTRDSMVQVEWRLSSGRIADVAVLRNGEVTAVVEVHVTHAVDDNKAEDLDGIPCAELEASQVIQDPLNWHPKEKRARRKPCPKCRRIDALYIAAGVPRWIDQAAIPVGHEGALVSTFILGKQEIHLINDYYGGARKPRWRNFDVVVAHLTRQPTPQEWNKYKPIARDYAKRRARKFPALPNHLALYWEIESILAHFGGEWATDLPRGPWENRKYTAHEPQCADPVEARQKMKAEEEKRWARMERISASTGQPVPNVRKSSYWAEPFRCWHPSCSEDMLVYTWKRRAWMTAKSPPDPRPPTIQLRFSKRAGKEYWVNTCPYCGRTQDDESVYRPDGPLPEWLRE
jgi:hypothetical protein